MRLELKKKALIQTYELEPFVMRVQSLNRTIIDKVFAVCDYYLLDKSYRNARHLYDIYKLSRNINVDDSFIKLFDEVRMHRIEMGIEIAPSAQQDKNILEIAQIIYSTQFYKNDYFDTITRLISDSIAYEETIENYLKIVEKIFTYLDK